MAIKNYCPTDCVRDWMKIVNPYHHCMKYLFLIIWFFWLFGSVFASTEYAVSKLPTPVFLTSDIASYFGWWKDEWLKLTKQWLIDPLEFVAPVWTSFQIIKELQDSKWNTIYQVSPDVWRYKSNRLFIDARFVTLTNQKPVFRKPQLPSKIQIIKNLLALQWKPYVRGGSYGEWIAQMLIFYPTIKKLTEREKQYWMLAWVDCSGLLHEATDGYTPKNTRQLALYWNAVKIAWLDRDQIIKLVEPLDIIVWPGHVIIVWTTNYTIESTIDADIKKKWNQSWVVVRKLPQVLDEILWYRKKKPLDNIDDAKNGFVIRRRYPN